MWTIGIILAGYWLGNRIPGIDTYLLPIIAVIIAVSLIPVALEFRRMRRTAREPAHRVPRSRPTRRSPGWTGEPVLPGGHRRGRPAGRHRAVPGVQPGAFGDPAGGDRWAVGHATWTCPRPNRPYLAFIVGLHVATAAALLVFFWRDWVRIVGGFFSSIRHRRVTTDSERLAWLIILATIPIGLAGLLLEHTFRTVLGRPMPAAAFLFANGVILLVGERLRRRALATGAGDDHRRTGRSHADRRVDADPDAGIDGPEADLRSDQRLAGLSMKRGVLVGCLADPGPATGDQPVRGGHGRRV